MASKTIDHLTMTVAVNPYEHEGTEYDALLIIVSYKKGRGFCVSWQPVKLTYYGYQTGPMPSSDPLVGGKGFVVQEATKNSVKTLQQMITNLEMAKDAIAWLFDHRDWDKLLVAVRNIALFGYTERYRRQMEELMSKTVDESPMMKQFRELKAKNSEAVLLFRCGNFYETYEDDAKVCADILGITLTKSTKHDYQMAGFPHHALDTYLTKLVRAGKKVAICDQINENDNENKENKTMTTVKMNNESVNVQNAQVNNEANEAVENVSVGEVSVDDIQPAMAPVEGSEYSVTSDGKDVTFSSVVPNIEPEKPAVTVPLGDHGTLVVGGVPTVEGQKSKVEGQKSELSPVRLVTYTTRHGETAPRIIGFSGEDDPRWKPIYDEKQALVAAYNKAKKKDPKAKMTSSPFGPAWLADRDGGSDEKTYCMTFGVKYMECAVALCEAYNTTDREAWKQAEQAVRDCKNGIVAGYQAEKAARKAERKAKKAAKDAAPKTGQNTMSNEEQQMFNLFKRFMSGDKDAMEQVNAVLNKAA